jgi:hypothetical protein
MQSDTGSREDGKCKEKGGKNNEERKERTEKVGVIK